MDVGIRLKPKRELLEMTSVLVIDDDRDTVEVFCEYLSIKDIKVLGKGYDGRTAVELYKEHKPDVVLLDVIQHQAYAGHTRG